MPVILPSGPRSAGDRVLLSASILIWAVILFIGLVIILAITEQSPLQYTNLPFPVLDEVIQPGDVVHFKTDRCTPDILEPYPFSTIVYRNLVSNDNDTHMDLGTSFGTIGQGCMETIAAVQIPSSTPAGTYHFEGFVEVPGRLHSLFRVTWETEAFDVTE